MWLCKIHIKSFNRDWDYFKGMSQQEIEFFLKDKYFIFYNSNKFDSVLNTENGEVTVSISGERWLPARGPIKNYEFNSIRIENLQYKIREKPDNYFGPGVKVANKRNPYLLVKRPTKVIKINLKHRIHGSFQMVLDQFWTGV